MISRNLGLIVAIMVVSCCAHVAASEYIPMQASKGEVLYFRRGHNPFIHPKKDEEAVDEPGSELSSLEGFRNVASTEAIRPAVQISPSVTLAWDDLNYEVSSKDGPKRLLHDLEGWVKPGSLTALMVSRILLTVAISIT